MTVRRCAHESCNKKLRVTDWACKCGNVYCATHRPMDSHACGFLKGGTNNDKENCLSNQDETRRADEMRCVADKMKDRI